MSCGETKEKGGSAGVLACSKEFLPNSHKGSVAVYKEGNQRDRSLPSEEKTPFLGKKSGLVYQK